MRDLQKILNELTEISVSVEPEEDRQVSVGYIVEMGLLNIDFMTSRIKMIVELIDEVMLLDKVDIEEGEND